MSIHIFHKWIVIRKQKASKQYLVKNHQIEVHGIAYLEECTICKKRRAFYEDDMQGRGYLNPDMFEVYGQNYESN